MIGRVTILIGLIGGGIGIVDDECAKYLKVTWSNEDVVNFVAVVGADETVERSDALALVIVVAMVKFYLEKK